jgi:3-hydroxymyristoyl/3-hydroxydecanoyl-(acyl carrier protein) dehydratase
VSSLPENPQGKIRAEALRELFRDAETTAGSSDRPEVLEEVRGSGFRERLCRVPEDLACFPGHFPDLPMVPAVLQLDWVMELLGELLEAPWSVEGIDRAKFAAPLRPGERFRIRMHAVSDARIEFRIWNGEREHARGRVRMARRRPGP